MEIKKSQYSVILAAIAKMFCDLQDELLYECDELAQDVIESRIRETKQVINTYIDGQGETLSKIRDTF